MPSGKSSDRRPAPGSKSTRLASRSTKSALPVWRQIADRLEREIIAGRFKESGRLPTETQLASELGLSRHTLRRAVGTLVSKGILRNVPHMGTFIAPLRIPFTMTADARFSEAVRAAGLRPGIRQLSRRVCSPPPEIAKLLGIASRTQVTEIVDLLLANDVPLGCVIVWLPVDRFPRIGDMIDAAGSLRRALARTGVPSYQRRASTLISRAADDTEREWMGLDRGAIVIAIEGVSVDMSDEPTHAFNYRLHADRVTLIVKP